jgi:DNA-binding MarR family transcriptional regulator
MSFDREESAGYLANHMARLFARRLAKQTRPLGIVPGQFPLLLELWRQDGQSQKMLVETLDVEQATVANTLGRMERDGLVRREVDPVDSRSRRIFLRRKGRDLEEKATRAAQAVNAIALAGLTPPEAASFRAAMRRVIANLRR